MGKRRLLTELHSYGVYTRWEKQSKKLPKITEITQLIEIKDGVEFGYILKITGGKGKSIHYRIDHPPMIDSNGNEMAPFEGDYFINSNSYEFFLGDTVWEPYSQMEGEWNLTTWCEGKILAQKKFQLYWPK